MPSFLASRSALAFLLSAGLVLTACGVQPTASDPPSAPRPIIIDTDLDVSDIGAISALLLDPTVDVRAVTVSATGTGVTNCVSGRAVMQYLLEQLGSESVRYACGRPDAGPDAVPFPAEWRTAADTGWGIEMPMRPQAETPEAAADLLARAIADSPQQPTIVALGPWTNLEDAFAADASLLGQVAGIHAMAGAIDAPGNVFTETFDGDDHLEWNVVADPSAFRAVFETDVPITLVPLDATDDVPVLTTLVDDLADADANGAAGANLLYELMVRVPGRIGEGQQLWDELGALAFLDPELATWEELDLTLSEDGRLERAADAGRPARVAMAADAQATADALLAALRRGPERTEPFALAGEIAVTWDGTSCSVEGAQPLEAGVAGLTFRNTSGVPAAVAVIGVAPPHTWDELLELAADPRTLLEDGPPEWLVEAGSLWDDAADGAELTSTAVLAGGTYGPICLSGTEETPILAPGAPFGVAP